MIYVLLGSAFAVTVFAMTAVVGIMIAELIMFLRR